MAYKLSVSDTVHVPVIFDLANGNKVTKFKYTLLAQRLTEDDFQARIKNGEGVATNEKIKVVMTEIMTGWEGQTLVLDELNEPATFCAEALEVMFQTPKVLDIVTSSYLKEVGARAKN
jgi:hypothetical protein